MCNAQKECKPSKLARIFGEYSKMYYEEYDDHKERGNADRINWIFYMMLHDRRITINLRDD